MVLQTVQAEDRRKDTENQPLCSAALDPMQTGIFSNHRHTNSITTAWGLGNSKNSGAGISKKRSWDCWLGFCRVERAIIQDKSGGIKLMEKRMDVLCGKAAHALVWKQAISGEYTNLSVRGPALIQILDLQQAPSS